MTSLLFSVLCWIIEFINYFTTLNNHDTKAELNEIIKKASKSFYLSTLLLPSRIRVDVISLYAWCRVVDDDIDDSKDKESGHKKWKEHQAKLDNIYLRSTNSSESNEEKDVVHQDMKRIINKYEIPKSFPEFQLEGQLWDCQERFYETYGELVEYCERVASSVGLMMCSMMKASADSYNYACALGVAMQLTNIARDVGEDARKGRVYLPLSWLREEEISVKSLLYKPKHTPELGRVVKRLLTKADELYSYARMGISMLSLDCQWAVLSASYIYQHIKDDIVTRDCDSITNRASTGTFKKLYLITKAYYETYNGLISEENTQRLSDYSYTILETLKSSNSNS